MDDSLSICPGCGLKLKSVGQSLDKRFNASAACLQLYWDLSAFTLSLRDKEFPHQIAVDSYAAQHYSPNMKSITITFALIGLHLAFERGYTGREVQLAHIVLGQLHKQWPRFENQTKNAAITVLDVLQNITKDNYKEPLTKWGKSVWASWEPEHEKVRKIVDSYLKIS